VVASSDKAAGADVVRSMAERAGATITELEGSHVIMVSQPEAVTNAIMEAAGAVAQSRWEREMSARTAPVPLLSTVSQIDRSRDEGDRHAGTTGAAREKEKE
jgi:hypothetical protein